MTLLYSRFACLVIMCSALTGPLLAQSGPGQAQDAATDNPSEVDPKWLERLPKDDRAAIDPMIGYAPPAFPNDIKWLGEGDPLEWNELRGRVVVLQSWTSGSAAGRKWPARIAEPLKNILINDLQVIVLHTPEDADKAEEFLARQPPPANVRVAIDPTGAYCDALGIYKVPVNFVVDRSGAIRYAGLNINGVEQAVAKLIAEPLDAAKEAKRRQAEEAPEAPATAFPPISGSVGAATDVRGNRAPEFYAEEWITSQPSPAGKVVVIDFWATWCGPCVKSIPHLNELANEFRDSVVIVGLSSETSKDFAEGLEKTKLKPSSFTYSLALDSGRKMQGAVKATAIPHCLVMSRDWIVRWQGDPRELTPKVLSQIVKADQGTGGSAAKGKSKTKKRGWKTQDAETTSGRTGS